MTAGYWLATFGIDRFELRPLNDGGGDAAMFAFDGFRESERGVFGGSSRAPFRFSRDPPIASRLIIRCSLPERVFDDSNEITLAFIAGLYDGSSGGPASRKAMRSWAALDTWGFLGDVGVEGTEGSCCCCCCPPREGCVDSPVPPSSPSEPAMTSSKSNDSGFLWIFLVRFGTPAGGGIGATF